MLNTFSRPLILCGIPRVLVTSYILYHAIFSLLTAVHKGSRLLVTLRLCLDSVPLSRITEIKREKYQFENLKCSLRLC